MQREQLDGGGWVASMEAFEPDHAALMERLRSSLPLQQEPVHLFGKTHLTPRLTSWHGDPGCSYGYSRRRFEPEPWTEELEAVRARLEPVAGIRFNSVLVNYYRDGADSMGAHADDEKELGPEPDDIRIASVSLGARRRFVLRHRETMERRVLSLGEGSLLLMGGTLQRWWRHQVPKTRREVGPRLSLTFRMIRPTTSICSS